MKPFTLWINNVAPQLSPSSCPGMIEVRTNDGTFAAVCDTYTETIFADIKGDSTIGIYCVNFDPESYTIKHLVK